ncbi:AbrB/MazE/SpoVT family DNA-binding domain-containing protein [Halalkalicoccus salilacus]|uniref:AbrB/MazE/SpoVT family DNA-binding domain-containing protein n=1 Tax=Halalkalicoccus TaxID=332246 RepID=UPI002F9666B8
MTNEADDTWWPPAMFANQMQEAGEEAADRQQKMFAEWLSNMNAGSGTDAMKAMKAMSGMSGMGNMSNTGGLSQLSAMSMEAATFKTRVQSGGRISIPDAEREVLGIDEGDIVQTIVIPLNTGDDDDD